MNNIAKTTVLSIVIACSLMPHDALALSAERWAAIKEHRAEQKKEDDYRPKTGDICYATDDDVAWLTPAGRDDWEQKSNAEYRRLSASGSSPDKKFKYAAVAASGGTLINLDTGTKVKVLDGNADAKGYGFEGSSGKVLILSGPKAGQICFCNGYYLKNTQVESNESFFKSPEERKAHQALFVSEQLNKPISDMLAMNGVKIDAPLAAESIGTSSNYTGTMPMSWQPKIRCALGDVPVPFGKKLSEFPEYLSKLRITVEEGFQDEDIRCWSADNSLMVIPGWGVAKGVSFDFSKSSGDWALSQVLVIRPFQMNTSFLKMKFNQAVSTLSTCYGQPELADGKARWDRGTYVITLGTSKSDSTMGDQQSFGLILGFSQK